MAEYSVIYSRLTETADSISGLSKDYLGVTAEIESLMSALDSKWRSEAATQYKKEFDTMASNFESFDRILNQYSAYLTKTAEEYRSQDAKTMEQTNVLDSSALF